MREHEVQSSKPWKRYRGREHRCLLLASEGRINGRQIVMDVAASCGIVETGKTGVFWGYFVRVGGPAGELTGEDRHSIRAALRDVAEKIERAGWVILAIGLDEKWSETGLSGNSGWGYHPAYPTRAVHMLEPPPEARSFAAR